jgi:hypothetical protein
MKLIAHNGPWILLEDDERNSVPWRNLLLFGPGKPGGRHRVVKKRLGWNGERLSDGWERKMLAQYYPEVEQWIVDQCRRTDPKATSLRIVEDPA